MSWISKLLKPLLWVALAIIAVVCVILVATAFAAAWAAWTGATWASLSASVSAFFGSFATSWGASAIAVPFVGTYSIGLSVGTWAFLGGLILAVGGYCAPEALSDVLIACGLRADDNGVSAYAEVRNDPTSRPSVINPDDYERRIAVLVDPDTGVDTPHFVTCTIGELLRPPTYSKQGATFQTWRASTGVEFESEIEVTEDLTSIVSIWQPVPNPPLEDTVVVRFLASRSDGSPVILSTRTVTRGQGVGILPSSALADTFAPPNHHFSHWALQVDGDVYLGVTAAYVVQESVDLWAIYQPSDLPSPRASSAAPLAIAAVAIGLCGLLSSPSVATTTT